MTNRPFLLFAYILFPLIAVAQDAVKAPIAVLRSQGELEEETGAAFLVGEKDGKLYFLTAAHVIADPKSIKMQFFKGATVDGQLVKSNQPLDMAVVSCAKPANYTPPPAFALSKTPEKNLQTVIVAGHPLGNYWDINFNSNVKSTEYDLDDRLFTLAPIGIAPGNSGGPVLNQQYELLGLVSRVDQVNAICVDAATLLRACQTWEIPLNLMTGVTIETPSQSGQEDFRYQLFVQEANTAFGAKKWAQAKTAYAQADALQATPAFKEKIQQCEVEMAKDEGYRSNLEQGKKATDLNAALGFFQKAQTNRDTEEVRNLIQQCKERLAKLGIESAKTPMSDQLPERINDPLAGEYVLVRGGTFTMGCDTCERNQAPAHQVYLDDYYMSTHRITTELYAMFFNDQYSDPLNATRAHHIESIPSGLKVKYVVKKGYEKSEVSERYDNLIEYCQWLSKKTGYLYRLPTEAEWEYAARGGHKRGNRTAEDIKNNNSPSFALGIQDMMKRENYASPEEAVSDYYSETYYTESKSQGVVANPTGPVSCMPCSQVGYEGTFRVSKGYNTITVRNPKKLPDECVFHLVRSLYPMSLKTQLLNRLEQNMQFVKGGTFSMGWPEGAPDHQPVHQVTVDDFYIGKTEFTQEMWAEVMGNGDRELLPVTGLTWDSIQQFIRTLNSITGMNYRLPTEAEWEYAARGGSNQQDPSWKFSGSKVAAEVAKMHTDWKEKMYVAQRKPNTLGLFDMSGNAAEYCSDWYHENYYKKSPKTNPRGPVSGTEIVTRGGYKGDKPYEEAGKIYLSVFTRHSAYPTEIPYYRIYGFRLVRSVK